MIVFMPARPDWSESIIRASQLPDGGLDSARLRFELVGPGRLWVDVVGRGTGIDDQGYRRKCRVVAEALNRNAKLGYAREAPRVVRRPENGLAYVFSHLGAIDVEGCGDLDIADVVFAGHYEDDGRLGALDAVAAIGVKLNVFGGAWPAKVGRERPLWSQFPIAPVVGEQQNEDERAQVRGPAREIFLQRVDPDVAAMPQHETRAEEGQPDHQVARHLLHPKDRMVGQKAQRDVGKHHRRNARQVAPKSQGQYVKHDPGMILIVRRSSGWPSVTDVALVRQWIGPRNLYFQLAHGA